MPARRRRCALLPLLLAVTSVVSFNDRGRGARIYDPTRIEHALGSAPRAGS